ncbi:Gfo/Idh/MocA family oxidoreductase [Verrucomicrobia bacterium]|nr:Gfo/Idh/MocA family oxidoreductase [Verrucomicrobiota bacterium]MDB4717502.1 Gfo/Idh/MocA family oxidoreductase [Verrucomicrobiota bacterium]
MKKIKVGVIGYGWVAGAHIQAINATSQAEVCAVYSSRPLNSDAVSAEHGSSIQCYQDLKDMLNDPSIDAVSVCSYPYQHRDHAVAAAKAGKHVILEKPMALSWKDCVAIRDAIEKVGVLSCICFECRYSSQFLTTKSIIDEGLLGRIHYGEIDYYHGIGPWYGQYRWNTKKDAGGSSLLSAGCHALDALLLCMGTDVESVTSLSTGSSSKDFKAYEYETTSVTLLKFKDGRVGKVASVIDCIQPYYFHTHLVGSEGSLLDNKLHSSKLGGLDKTRWSELSMKMLDSGDVSDHPYQSQFEAFFSALKKNKPMPLTHISDALRTHEILFAADRSAKSGGRTIKVS